MNTTAVWFCDTCDKPIEDATKGNLIWLVGASLEKTDFQIVHKGACDRNRDASSWELGHTLGLEGQAFLLSFLSDGALRQERGRRTVSDMDAFIDLYRRLQTPGYEEARRYFDEPEVREHYSDSHEFAPYTPEGIARIIELGRASG